MCRKRPACTKRATTVTPTGNSDTVEVIKFVEHPHLPAPEAAAALKAYSQMKRTATEHPEAPPAQILRNALPQVPSSTLAHLPLRESMKRTFNKRWQGNLPANPKTLQELGEIPNDFRVTLGKKTFLIYDSYDDTESGEESDEEAERRRRGKRILVYSSKTGLKALARSPVWQLDGTFETSPDIFAQILTIHGEYHGEMLPMAFALLPDKHESTYTRVLEAIKDVCARQHIRRPGPTTAIMDFEKGLNNAVAVAFPDTELRLCLFHLKQAAFRKIQQLGLTVQYRDEDDDSIRMAFRQILGVAFVPVEDVEDAFRHVTEEIPDEMKPFSKYFAETYVLGRVVRGRRRTAPRYPPDLWNQHLSARHNEPRTNNTTEAWHNRFQKMVGKSHPTVFNLIKEFQKEEGDVRVMMAELDAGKTIRQRRRQEYRRINERLQNLATRYDRYKEEDRVVDFARACGHNICME
ncbi:PKS-NRPS hybrid synthetase [Frankliniella fusca]|uniref:PKS-NRPS hybrid synthetase n=1 Tax=Frankliniella fusca TaxID=407009 RepID=A0AAE1GZ08_9NEOP|nr:PKS-NRPS hybrid synthetase [Frankliniella fusca]